MNFSSRRYFTLALVLSLSFVGLLGSFDPPASGSIGIALTTVTTFSPTVTTSKTTTTTSSTTSTTTSTSRTTTSTSTTTTSFSYSTTLSSTTTATTTLTSITNTVIQLGSGTVTFISTERSTRSIATTTTSTSTSLERVPPSIRFCPIGLVAAGSALEPLADFLRGFRNRQILSTFAGREFMVTFNAWYYGWAPGVARYATYQPWFANSLRAVLVPLFGILYASYYSYAFVAPLNSETAALISGAVAASLIGFVYIAPLVFLMGRILRLGRRLLGLRQMLVAPACAWVVASVLMVGAAYGFASSGLMGVATASMTLSMLGLGGLLGVRAIASIGLPFTGSQAFALVAKRFRFLAP